MSEMYEYTGKTTEPDLDQIHTDVAASAMTDKTIEYCIWDDSTDKLCTWFANALSGADKTAFDTVVTNNS